MKIQTQYALLAIALFGLTVPNGLFLYAVHKGAGANGLMGDKLALSFMLDAFVAMGLLAYTYAVRPIGKVRWYWFVGLSLLGGLAFSLPLYWWLNRRGSPPVGTTHDLG